MLNTKIGGKKVSVHVLYVKRSRKIMITNKLHSAYGNIRNKTSLYIIKNLQIFFST